MRELQPSELLSLTGPTGPARPLALATPAPLLHSTPSNHPAMPAAGGGVTPAFVLYALRRWGLVAAPIGLLLALLLAGGAWFYFTPQFRSSAWLKIENRKPVLVFKDDTESPIFVKTQVELLKSPLVLGRALAQAEVARLPEVRAQDAPLEWLSRRISIKAMGESELFQVAYEGPDPESVPKIVNAVVDGYLKIQSELADNQVQRTIELLEKERERRSVDLDRLRENLKTLARTAAGKDPSGAGRADVVVNTHSPIGELQDRLTAAEVEREVQEARLKAFEEMAAKGELPSQVNVPKMVAESPTYERLRLEVEALKSKLKAAEQVAATPDTNPAILRYRKDIEKGEKLLEEQRESLKESVSKEVNTAAQDQQKTAVAQLKAEIGSQKMLEGLLKERIGKQREEMEAAGDHSLELEFARGELARAEEVYQRISERAVQLRTEMRAPARVTLLEAASAPVSPSVKDRMTKSGVGAAAGFFLPFLLAVLWEHRLKRCSDSDQIRTATSFPVLAEIVATPTRQAITGSAGQVSDNDQSRRTFEESIHQLRTRLTLPDHLRDLRVIAVASAVSGEGKTSVATQLALSLARATHEPVLLIDSDMRAPDIHQIFDLPLGPGLAEVLDGRAKLDTTIVRGASESVHLLTAGKLNRNPNELLSSESLGLILDQLRATYRYIVIDAPPLLAASEAFVPAKLADGVILCAMRDVSRMPQVKLARDRLVASGARALGVVLSGVPCQQYARNYGFYQYETSRDA